MKIYGVALLAGCFLVGKFLGALLGLVLQIDGNVGGVGFAMALLIGLNSWKKTQKTLSHETKDGILFWGAMYIPIVVAMAACLNVQAALSGGWVALLVGSLCTLACFFLVPVLAKFGKENPPKREST